MFESLDSYVKGDLLEGANAYHCEKCSKKVSITIVVVVVVIVVIVVVIVVYFIG